MFFSSIADICYQITIIATQLIGDEYISHGDAAKKRGDAANTFIRGNSATRHFSTKRNYDSFDYLTDYDFSSIVAICYQVMIIATQLLGDEYISRGDAAIKRGDAANTFIRGNSATRHFSKKRNYDSFDYLTDYDFSSVADICFQITIIATQRCSDEYISRGDAAIKRGDAANTFIRGNSATRHFSTKRNYDSFDYLTDYDSTALKPSVIR